MIASDLDHLTPLPKQDLTSDELKSTIAGRNISSSAATELQPKRSFGQTAYKSVWSRAPYILAIRAKIASPLTKWISQWWLVKQVPIQPEGETIEGISFA